MEEWVVKDMVKTIGSRDGHKRKRRSDKGKKRKLYRGKPVKKKRKKFGKFVPYVPKWEKRGKFKIWIWEKMPMSKEGYRRFSRDIRHYMKRVVFKPRQRFDVSPETLSTKESVERFCEEHLYEGSFYIMGFGHGKNKYHTKPVKLCEVYITRHEDGLMVKLINNFRLHRYWFWRGK